MERKTATAVFVFLVALCRVSSPSCTIGNSDNRAQNRRCDQRFYLDVNNAASCTGTIISWTVCYYGRTQLHYSSYWATYAVYRRNDTADGDQRYERVSGVLSAVRSASFVPDPLTDGEIQFRNFMCYKDTSDSPLTIQTGDIIGACVFDPQDDIRFSRRQLDIVGQVSGESLLEANLPCTINVIPSSILHNDLQNRNDRRLHIYANIEPVITTPGPTTTTTAPVTTTDNPDTSTLLTFPQGTDQVSLIVTAAGSASGALIIGILSLMAIIAVVICLKHRQKTFQLTSNVAYTGQCTTEDIDYYVVSQPLAESNVETKDECFVTGDTTANESTEDQPLTMLYDTIDESQLAIADVPKLNEEVLHRNIETHADNQPSSVLYI